MKRAFLLAVLVAGLCSHVLGQTELVTNGTFESGLFGWTSSPGANATVVTNPVHSGTGALSITSINGTEVISQPITLPPNLIAATLSYYYDIFSVDGIHTRNAVMDVSLADMTGTPIVWVDEKDNTSWDQIAGTFHPVVLDLTPYMATNNGHLQIQFVVTSDRSNGTQFNIDDVSVQALDITARGLNDNFANAQVLSNLSATVTATNTYSTKEPGEPKHAGNAGGHSLWWRWTAPDWGTVSITTDGSTFDTLLAAYTGSDVSALTKVAANDDDKSGTTSQISFPVSPGTEYNIAVDGKDGATGMILLNLNFLLDTQRPLVAFTSPKAGELLTNDQVTVQGTAKDAVAVGWVEYRLENADGTNAYQLATGTTNWSATVTNLIPGPNTVRVLAFDMRTNVSAVSRSFYYDVLLSAKGTYAGLFSETNTLTTTNAGLFTANVATKGKFSAKLALAGHSYSLSGAFNTNGTFTKSVRGPNGSWLTAQLNLGISGEDAITGTVSSSLSWSAPLRANRAIYSRTSPAPQGNQKYTLVIPYGDETADQPAGYGFGALSVDVAGNIKFNGTLGDGTKVSQKTFVSKTAEWPLYLSAAAGKEVMTGWLLFTNTDESDFNGTVSWMRQPQRTKLYPDGFACTNGVAVVGSRYAFTNGVPVLDLPPSGGVVLLQEGNLPADLTYAFTLNEKNKIVGTTNKLSLTISTAAGTFKGTVPGPSKSISVSGALLQKQNAGFGCFSGTNQTGRVTLGSSPL